MLGLMRDPKVSLDLRLEMAVAAAPYVHAKPHAPSRLHTDPTRCDAIKSSPRDFVPARMENELRAPEKDDENRGAGSGGGGENGLAQKGTWGQAAQQGASQQEARERSGSGVGGGVVGIRGGDEGIGEIGETALAKNQLGEAKGAREGAAGEGGGCQGAELSPLQFLLNLMIDPAATPRQCIRAARVAARYRHAPMAPDKMPSEDEYGFAISRTLAMAIKADWLALGALWYLLQGGAKARRDPRPAGSTG